jgi:hypothetical protein
MAASDIAVFGVYLHKTSCEYALSALRTAGFRDQEISILIHKNLVANDHRAVKATTRADDASFTGSDATGVLAWLPGIGAGAVHSVEKFIFAGSVVATLLRSETDGASTSRGLQDALLRLGMSEQLAKQSQARVENGGILLFLNCPDLDCVRRATNWLKSTGAESIATATEV